MGNDMTEKGITQKSLKKTKGPQQRIGIGGSSKYTRSFLA